MDKQTPRSRRSLLIGGAAAAAAWAASLAGRAVPEVDAANGQSVILGSSSNSASATTTVTNTNSGSAIQAIANSSGSAGVYGSGTSTGYGLFSSGRLGVTGPVELAPITLSNYTTPSGKAFLYLVRNNNGTHELRVRFPSGTEKTIAAG